MFPSPTMASRGKEFKSHATLMWIKKNPVRPNPSPPGSDQPSVIGSIAASPRRSGLHRILGFHWRSQRGLAPVSRGNSPNVMAGRPDSAGKSGLFGALRQGGGGTYTAGPSFGGGAAMALPSCSAGARTTPPLAALLRTPGSGSTPVLRAASFSNCRVGMATLPFRNPLRAG
jgi:hypothetical protein